MASASNTNPLLEYLEEGKTYEVDFGDTWNEGNSSKYAYHTIKYDFKPASVVKSDQGELTVGSIQDVSIALPNVEGSSTKFSGNTKSYTQKECLMIIDPQTGKIVIERLSANVRVKNVRVENRPSNPPIKPAVARTNPPESQTEKKPAPKPTTTTAAPTKPTTQKVANTTKPTVTAPVKPMPSKRTLSPMDDRLSDEDSSPESDQPAPVQMQAEVVQRRTSDAVLKEDLALSDDTSDEEL